MKKWLFLVLKKNQTEQELLALTYVFSWHVVKTHSNWVSCTFLPSLLFSLCYLLTAALSTGLCRGPGNRTKTASAPPAPPAVGSILGRQANLPVASPAQEPMWNAAGDTDGSIRTQARCLNTHGSEGWTTWHSPSLGDPALLLSAGLQAGR